MGKPTCNFCGQQPDAIVNDVACCRACALKTLPRLVARAFVGPVPMTDKTVLYQTLLSTFAVAYWQEIAAIISEREENALPVNKNNSQQQTAVVSKVFGGS